MRAVNRRRILRRVEGDGSVSAYPFAAWSRHHAYSAS